MIPVPIVILAKGSGFNHTVFGRSFYVVAKDNQGKVYKSAAAVIKRSGYANCLTSSAPYKRCAWSGGIVIGPTPNYAVVTNQSCQ